MKGYITFWKSEYYGHLIVIMKGHSCIDLKRANDKQIITGSKVKENERCILD